MISQAATERPHVLIVDDEDEILVALTDLLEDEFEILATSDPFRALELLRDNPSVAAIISDQRMPGLTGDQLLARARQFSDARSILLTGYADLDVVVSALNQGRVQAYIHKPWESDALRSLVGEVARHCLAQRALQTEQALLRGLMQALPIGLVFSDAQGGCIRSNVRTRADIEGEDELTHFPEPLRPTVRKMRDEVAASGQAEHLLAETVPVTGGGVETRWHELTRLALAWPPGASARDAWQVCMDRDVTQRVQMEERLRQSDKLQALGTLAGGIAHDFNNLLAAISGSLELLEDIADLDETGRSLLKNAADSATRGLVLTRRLLHFGRPREVRFGPVRVAQLLSDLKDLLAQSLKPRSDAGNGDPHGEPVRRVLRIGGIPEDLPDIWSDAGQLEMALVNLCVNARDAMPNGGEVRIGARVVPQRLAGLPEQCSPTCAVAIDVSDDGEGMSAEVMKRIFDPFFTTKDVGRGTGLGLSGVYGFVSRNYGEVLVESTPGEGTTMTLVLPAAIAESRQGREVVPFVRRRVLVVDDEAAVRLVTEQFLKQDGHDVTGAASMMEALDAVARLGTFDAAVIDVRMPEHDGFSCARALREQLPDLAVVFVSGEAGDMASEANAEILAKPFTQEELREALRRI